MHTEIYQRGSSPPPLTSVLTITQQADIIDECTGWRRLNVTQEPRELTDTGAHAESGKHVNVQGVQGFLHTQPQVHLVTELYLGG